MALDLIRQTSAKIIQSDPVTEKRLNMKKKNLFLKATSTNCCLSTALLGGGTERPGARCSLLPIVSSRDFAYCSMWPNIDVVLVGRTDAPSCRLLFSRSANERPGAAESQPNESSGVWARIESWVVQSVRRTTISPECTGWIRGGDGNVSELLFQPLSPPPRPRY